MAEILPFPITGNPDLAARDGDAGNAVPFCNYVNSREDVYARSGRPQHPAEGRPPSVGFPGLPRPESSLFNFDPAPPFARTGAGSPFTGSPAWLKALDYAAVVTGLFLFSFLGILTDPLFFLGLAPVGLFGLWRYRWAPGDDAPEDPA
ncbi:hypothetical protein [Nisaea sediminum]|uniref:hypothetical protein n=1 Tax=Nisaea sediminum TaxID=2775867 RepID=UPI0018678CA2|nr:hypothetical protein [Nisaea sediminum]